MKDVFHYHETLSPEQRKLQGSFFTPKIWVDQLYDLIAVRLGDNWRKRATVWDMACGAGALTYDRDIERLYCSGIEEPELDIVRQTQPNAHVFNFDFLNDLSFDLPEELNLALAGGREPFVVIMNPPYGKPPHGARLIEYYASLGRARQETACLFLARCADFARNYRGEFHIFSITKNVFTSPMQQPFVDYMDDRVSNTGGFMFNSNEFPTIKAQWPVMVSHWVNRPIHPDLGIDTKHPTYAVLERVKSEKEAA